MLNLEFIPARIQEFGGYPGTPNHVRLTPNVVSKVSEAVVENLFKPGNEGGDPTIEFYRQNGDLIIRKDNGAEWLPGGSKPAHVGSNASSHEVAPVQVSRSGPVLEMEPEEPHVEVTKPAQMGGGVPGQGVKDCKNNVKDCEDLDVLNGWKEIEKRTTILSAIEAQINKLQG